MKVALGYRGQIAAAATELGALARSLRDLIVAAIAAPFRRLSPRTSEYVITACVLWALVSPLLLWISWSRTGFVLIIGSAALAVALIYLLILLHPGDPFRDRPHPSLV